MHLLIDEGAPLPEQALNLLLTCLESSPSTCGCVQLASLRWLAEPGTLRWLVQVLLQGPQETRLQLALALQRLSNQSPDVRAVLLQMLLSMISAPQRNPGYCSEYFALLEVCHPICCREISPIKCDAARRHCWSRVQTQTSRKKR